MKSVMLPLTWELNTRHLAETTALIAKHLGANITGIFIRRDPRSAVPMLGEGLTAEVVQNLCDATETEGLKHAKAAETDYTEVMQNNTIPVVDSDTFPKGMKARWRVLTGEITDHVGRSARTFDFSICTRPKTKGTDQFDIFTDLIFRSGRSVLMLPSSRYDLKLEHILIAWNGRAECARAVAGALPILAKAKKITLLQVGTIDEDRPSLADIASYLRDHDIKTEQHQIEQGGRSIGEAVLNHADNANADITVIGAFSQARWRELILGSVTKHLVEHSTKPVYMSH